MTTPINPPISMDDVAAELRVPADSALELGDPNCKRLAGINRTVQTVSLSDLQGKTRPYWASVSTRRTGGLYTFIGYNKASGEGWLLPSTDPYLGSVEITFIGGYIDSPQNETTLNFASDPGFRNNLKIQVIDTATWSVLREVVLSYYPGSGQWRSAQSADNTYNIWTTEGIYELTILKL